jgi:tetratricopeptide (TPR) repeat protein
VAVITMAAFLPTLRNDFVDFDDARNFVMNPAYRGLGLAQLKWMFTSAHMGHYIPLTWITLGLDYTLWGMNPAGYHFTSLVLHVITAALFYGVAYRVICAATRDTGSWPAAAGALLAALVFAVHPLRVESVAWITERRDVLSGAFFMATLLAWFRAIEHERIRWRWYAVSLILFTCALLSKVITLTLPAVLIVLDVYPFGRLGGAQGWWTRRARAIYAEKIPFAVIGIAAGTAAFVVVASTVRNMASYANLGVAERAAISIFSLAFYVGKTLLPTSLSPLYDLRLPVEPLAVRYVGAAGVVVAMSALAVVLRHRARWFGVAWAAYVTMSLPVLGLLQNGPQVAADRYTYLACLPWALVAGGLAAEGFRRAAAVSRERLLGGAIAAVALVIVLEMLTVSQTRVWRDSLGLWTHAVRVDPSSPIARNNLAAALVANGNTDEAIEALRHAVALSDTPRLRAGMVFGLARLLQQRGDVIEAESLYRETLALERRQPDAWNNLGVILAQRGQFEPALEAFRAAIVLSPRDADACKNGRRVAALLHQKVTDFERCGPAGQT